MVREIKTAYQMTARNTFTAISFNTKLLRTKRIDMLDVVSVHNGEIGVAESFEFNPMVDKPIGRNLMSFVDVFGYIRDKLEDRDVPVPLVGWGVDDGMHLSSLIESHNIDIKYPVRYFNLQDSARKRMRNEKIADNWRMVAKELQLEVMGTKRPTALDCAKIHLKLEATDYQLIVARAFLAFIRSIMYDSDSPNGIDTFEAKGLQSFLSLLIQDFEQFRDLKAMVDETLADNVVVDDESNSLMKELTKMEAHYQAYVDSCDRKD